MNSVDRGSLCRENDGGAAGVLSVQERERELCRAAILDRRRAFFHETRLLYFASYIWTRYRQDRTPPWAAPSQLIGFGLAVVRNRLGGRAPHSVLR